MQVTLEALVANSLDSKVAAAVQSSCGELSDCMYSVLNQGKYVAELICYDSKYYHVLLTQTDCEESFVDDHNQEDISAAFKSSAQAKRLIDLVFDSKDNAFLFYAEMCMNRVYI